MSDIVILPPFEWEGVETKYSIIESVHLIPRKLIQIYLRTKRQIQFENTYKYRSEFLIIIVTLPPFEGEGAETKYSIIESVYLIPRRAHWLCINYRHSNARCTGKQIQTRIMNTNTICIIRTQNTIRKMNTDIV